ncbi:hypothetical protein GUITHDRAFT_107406 [Guillardia theta CCMP2712]|uniref:Uncharacterized protein n=2 Tax=Guillardia theta TaxID=55529 RepID=L1JDK6_GUITC|nr:hypothetical protein GUITHDRAFT_107406 [Guillardia theta CCMP2712]EKX46623.1 hypothetical protein GUITHDRAFT_107406 [Guillardia theta CCMP2712]|eukprot:XP_005833603.1 hypothetical protein GUITHDRAFT_107406 [Guillardia theta CCMP2712]
MSPEEILAVAANADGKQKQPELFFMEMQSLVKGGKAYLKELGFRDKLIPLLLSCMRWAMGPLARNHLAELMCLVGSVEGRAIIPIIDGILEFFNPNPNKQSKDEMTRLNALICLQEMVEKHGMYISSKLGTVFVTCKGVLKTSEDERVRLAGSETLTLVIDKLGRFGRSSHEEAFKIVKLLLFQKQSSLRVAGAQLLYALAVHCDNCIPVENQVANVLKVLSDPALSQTVAVKEMSLILGDVLYKISGNKSGGSEEGKGLRDRFGKRRVVVGVKGVHDFLSAIFWKDKCPQFLRIAITRSFKRFFQAFAASESSTETVQSVKYVLDLASPRSASKGMGEDSRLKAACVSDVLRGVSTSLSEDGRALLVSLLLNEVMNRGHSLLGEHRDLSQAVAVTCALGELAYLYSEMGGVQPAVEVKDFLLKLCAAPWTPTRVAAAEAIRAYCSCAPELLLPTLQECLNFLHMEVGLTQSESSSQKIHGLSCFVVTLMAAAKVQVHGLPCALLDSVMSLSKMMLKEAFRAANEGSSWGTSRVEGAWAMICACLRSGYDWIETYLPVLPRMWAEHITDAASGDSAYREMLLEFRMMSMSGALTSIRVLLAECPQAIEVPQIAHSVKVSIQHALQSDLITKSPKLLLESSKSLDLHATRADGLKLRLFQLLCVAPLSLVKHDAHLSILRRTFQVMGRAASKRGAGTTLVADFLNPDDDSLLPHEMAREPQACPLDHCEGNLGNWDDDPVCDAKIAELWDDVSPSDDKLNSSLVNELVDAAVNVFVRIFPSSSWEDQSVLIVALSENVLSLQDANHRNVAVLNICAGLLGALKSMAEKGSLLPNCPEWRETMPAILQTLLSEGNLLLKRIAGESIALVLRLSPEKQMESAVAMLMSPPKAQEETFALGASGKAFALGCLYRYVGGMRCNRHLNPKSTIEQLSNWMGSSSSSSSLCKAWTVHGISLIIEYATVATDNLAFMALDLVKLELKEEEAEQELEEALHPTFLMSAARLSSAVISTIGPEIMPGSDILTTIMAIVDQLKRSRTCVWKASCLEAISLLQKLILFLPRGSIPSDFILQLIPFLNMESTLLHRKALTCLRQTADQNLQHLKTARGLEKCLLRLADMDQDEIVQAETKELILLLMLPPSSDMEPIESFITLRDVVTGKHDKILFHDSFPPSWVPSSSPQQETQEKVKEEEESKEDLFEQEDGEDELEGSDSVGARVSHPAGASSSSSSYSPRWQTRFLALNCLHLLLRNVHEGAAEGRGGAAHFDLKLARASAGGEKKFLIAHINSIISMAYNAISSSVNPLRVAGITLLEVAVRVFAASKDPDVEDDAPLLEQFQAQINSVIKSALNGTASPSVSVGACNVCWELISRDVYRNEPDGIRRILTLLMQSVVRSVAERNAMYSDMAYATVQMTLLTTLARLLSAQCKDRALVSSALAEDGEVLCRLWAAGIRQQVRVSMVPVELANQITITEEEETISAGVFQHAIHPLLASCVPSYLRAVATFVSDSLLKDAQRAHELCCEVLLLTIVLLRWMIQVDSSRQTIVGDPASICAIAASLRTLLTRSVVERLKEGGILRRERGEGGAGPPLDAAECWRMLQGVAVAMVCTPSHLSVADAGIDLLLHLARVVPEQQREGRMEEVVVGTLLAPVNEIFVEEGNRGRRLLRLSAKGLREPAAISRSARAFAGISRFLQEVRDPSWRSLRRYETRKELEACVMTVLTSCCTGLDRLEGKQDDKSRMGTAEEEEEKEEAAKARLERRRWRESLGECLLAGLFEIVQHKGRLDSHVLEAILCTVTLSVPDGKGEEEGAKDDFRPLEVAVVKLIVSKLPDMFVPPELVEGARGTGSSGIATLRRVMQNLLTHSTQGSARRQHASIPR